MERYLLLHILSIALLGGLVPTWSEDKLISPLRLEMFVDELPDVPKIRGFDFVDGAPKPRELKIGMYKKKWVSSSLFLLLFYS
uniref:Uncharacterized protein MANES_15G126800 n=1 Tax=Rhizophora mucronata TaxID=61149 RepID=A0A2P2J5X5_RHIMU